ncbi:MAG TPA: hypothetical protein VE398_20435, partial [Acidobacteriota bacterium]|nr:hypothetical protein [Acidobacteriota bacterium]
PRIGSDPPSTANGTPSRTSFGVEVENVVGCWGCDLLVIVDHCIPVRERCSPARGASSPRLAA